MSRFSPRNKVVVQVTQKHIDKGQRWSPRKDAISLALRDAGLRRWRSGWTCFSVGKYSKRVPMSAQVKDFIKQFDYDRHTCKPFEFEVDLLAART